MLIPLHQTERVDHDGLVRHTVGEYTCSSFEYVWVGFLSFFFFVAQGKSYRTHSARNNDEIAHAMTHIKSLGFESRPTIAFLADWNNTGNSHLWWPTLDKGRKRVCFSYPSLKWVSGEAHDNDDRQTASTLALISIALLTHSFKVVFLDQATIAWRDVKSINYREQPAS